MKCNHLSLQLWEVKELIMKQIDGHMYMLRAGITCIVWLWSIVLYCADWLLIEGVSENTLRKGSHVQISIPNSFAQVLELCRDKKLQKQISCLYFWSAQTSILSYPALPRCWDVDFFRCQLQTSRTVLRNFLMPQELFLMYPFLCFDGRSSAVKWCKLLNIRRQRYLNSVGGRKI